MPSGRGWREPWELLTLVRPYDSAASPTQQPLQQPFWIGLTEKTSTATPSIRRQVYDGLGRQIQLQTAGAVLDSGTQDVVVDRRFDAYGRVIQQTVPYAIGLWNGSGSPYRGQQLSQPSTQTGYDVLGRPSAVTAPDGTRSEHRYGVVADGGTVLAWHDVLDPNRHRLQSRTDAFGRLVQVLEISGNCGSWGYACSGAYTTPWATGTTTSYRYDALDRLTTVTRGGLVTTIGYDAAGRKTQLQDPDMGTWTYAYDGAGNLVKQRDARNIATCLYYDALHRLEGKTYHYHPQQRVNRVSTTSQVYVASSSYDAAGRLTARSLGTDTVIASAAYFPWTTPHGQGRLQRLTAGTTTWVTALQDLRYSTSSTGTPGYDAGGNLLRIEDWKAGSPQVHTYSYDERDRLLSASVTGGLGGNYSETDAYDPVTGTPSPVLRSSEPALSVVLSGAKEGTTLLRAGSKS